MKALILSDIHSNIRALEGIWAREHDCDRIFCAGDLVDYGPHPREVLAWIRDHDVACVQGNHDAWVCLNYRQCKTLDTVPAAERSWVHYNAGLLDEADITYLEALPQTMTFRLNGRPYALTHHYRDYDEIVSLHAYEQFRTERFDGAAFNRLILGHTHRQAVRYLSDEILWLNPGSVSYRRPDDPDQTAHYATIVNGRIHLHRLAYDTAPLYHLVQQIPVNTHEKETAVRFFKPRANTPLTKI